MNDRKVLKATTLVATIAMLAPFAAAQNAAPPAAANNPSAPAAAPARLGSTGHGEMFGERKARLPLLDKNASGLGSAPVTTEETKRKLEGLVSEIIDPETTLDLVLGRQRVLVFNEPPTRVQIPDEMTATFSILSEKEVSVVGTKVGTTLLNVWFPNGSDAAHPRCISYLVRVVPDPEERARMDRVYSALEDEINAAFPESAVKLSMVGENLVVRGEARDLAQARQIIALVEANSPDDAVRIPVDSNSPSAAATGADPSQTGPGLDSYAVSGRQRVINMIHIPGEAQVMLRVTVAEVSRSAARSLGVNWAYTDGGKDAFSIAQGTGSLFRDNLSNVNSAWNYTNNTYKVALNALRQLNLARSLAEPNLTTLNGQPASFQAGGSFPVPVVTEGTQQGLQGVRYQNFGVQMKFTPYVTDGDLIKLDLNVEASTRQLATGTNVAGSQVAGLDTRNFTSTVELREGQTLAVAGIIQSNFGSTADRFPVLGDIPIIGWFFGFDRTSNAEQELVVLVTPELVHPLETKDLGPLPGADVFDPSDTEFFLLNRIEGHYRADWRGSVRTNISQQWTGRDEDKYITPIPYSYDRAKFNKTQSKVIAGPSGYSDGR